MMSSVVLTLRGTLHLSDRHGAVRIESEYCNPFTADVADGLDLTGAIGVEVDFTAWCSRGSDGQIIGGRLTEVAVVDQTANPVEVWRDWFAQNASHWNDVDDIEGELGR